MFRLSSTHLSTIGLFTFLILTISAIPGLQSVSLANSVSSSETTSPSPSSNEPQSDHSSPQATPGDQSNSPSEVPDAQVSSPPEPTIDANDPSLSSIDPSSATDPLTPTAYPPMVSGPGCNQGTCLFIQVRTSQRAGPEMILGFNWQLSSPEMAKVEVLNLQQANARRKADQDFLLAKQNDDRAYTLSLLKELRVAIATGDVYGANLYAAAIAPLMGYKDGHALLNALWVNPTAPGIRTIPTSQF